MSIECRNIIHALNLYIANRTHKITFLFCLCDQRLLILCSFSTTLGYHPLCLHFFAFLFFSLLHLFLGGFAGFALFLLTFDKVVQDTCPFPFLYFYDVCTFNSQQTNFLPRTYYIILKIRDTCIKESFFLLAIFVKFKCFIFSLIILKLVRQYCIDCNKTKLL